MLNANIAKPVPIYDDDYGENNDDDDDVYISFMFSNIFFQRQQSPVNTGKSENYEIRRKRTKRTNVFINNFV